MKKLKNWLRSNLLFVCILACIIISVALGFGLRHVDLSHEAKTWIKIPGELFIRSISLLVLPLVLVSIVNGLSGLDSSSSCRLGVSVLLWVFGTQLISVTIGILLAIAIKPGQDLAAEHIHSQQKDLQTSYSDIFADFLRNLIPDNIVRSCLEHAYTERITLVQSTNQTNMTDLITYKSQLIYKQGMNVMGIVTFSILLGIGIQASSSDLLKDLFKGLFKTVFKMMDMIIIVSPVGIFSLILGALLDVDDLTGALRSVGLFVLTVFAGLAIHQVVVLPLLLFLLTRENPLKILTAIMDAIIAATAASTGMLALPILLHDTQEKLKVDSRVANFSLPIFATINRDGSCLFICVAAIFVAQSYAVPIATAQYIVLGLIVTLLCAAVAAVPSASVMVLIMVSSTLNITVSDRLGLIMALEWLLDRMRASTNIQSNGFGVVVLNAFFKGKIGGEKEEEGTDEKKELVADQEIEV